MEDRLTCPECGNSIHKRAYKHHLVEAHGYCYTAESPDMPVKVNDNERIHMVVNGNVNTKCSVSEDGKHAFEQYSISGVPQCIHCEILCDRY